MLTVLCVVAVAHPALGQRKRIARPPDASTALVLRVAAARTLPARVAPADRAALRKVVALLRAGKQNPAKAEFERFAESYFNAKTKPDVTKVVEWVLRESYIAGVEPLRDAADRVRSYNETKKTARQQLQALRRANVGPAGKPRRWRSVTLRRSKKLLAARLGAWQTGNKQALDVAIDQLEKELQQIGDDDQLANIDLQNALQKQQQTVQLLSALSKTLHDVAMGVIRKIS